MPLDGVALKEKKLVARRDELRPRRWSRRHRGVCLGVEDVAFQEKDGYMDVTSHTEGCEVTSVEKGHDVEEVTAQNDERNS